MKVSFLIITLLTLSLATSYFVDDASAAVSSGTSSSKYGSATSGIVCGDRLCSEVRSDPNPPSSPVEPIPEESQIEEDIPEEEIIEEEEESTEIPTPPPPTLTQISENVYHYFGGFYNSLVVMSPDDVLITDPANDMRALMLKEEIAKITDTPVTKIVLTHEHYDHAGGTGVFENAEIICQEKCQETFDLDPFNVTPDAVDIEFDDFLSIDVGDTTTVELYHFGPADGEAHTVIYLPQEKIIATADLYGSQSITPAQWMDDKNYLGVHKIFNIINTWEIKHAVNSHSSGTDPVDLHENIEFVNDLHDAVYAELDTAIQNEGMFAAFEKIQTLPNMLELEQYSDWERYEENFPKHVQRMVLAILHGD